MSNAEILVHFMPAHEALGRCWASAKDQPDHNVSDWETLSTALPRFAHWWKPHTSREDFLIYFKETHAALHRRWTKAVDRPGYVKSDWRLIDNALARFARDVAPEIGIGGTEPLL